MHREISQFPIFNPTVHLLWLSTEVCLFPATLENYYASVEKPIFQTACYETTAIIITFPTKNTWSSLSYSRPYPRDFMLN